MGADGWPQRLNRLHAHGRPLIMPAPPPGAIQRDWVRSGALPAVPGRLPYVAELSYFRASHGRAARAQWLAAGKAAHVAMLIYFLCCQFQSAKKCDFRPTRQQQYLGIVCDLDTATFRVPQEKLDKLQLLRRAAVDGGQLSFRTIQRIAGKCMSMTVAIRPAWLWTHTYDIRGYRRTRDVRAPAGGPSRTLPPAEGSRRPGTWCGSHFTAHATKRTLRNVIYVGNAACNRFGFYRPRGTHSGRQSS